jgi:hypothetical protein
MNVLFSQRCKTRNFSHKPKLEGPPKSVPRFAPGAQQKGNCKMRKVILGAATALAFASPALAADYSERSSYEREVHTYEQREARPVVVERRAARPVVVEEWDPVVSETVVVRRPVVLEPRPVVVEEYPVYAAPRAYAYAGPGWRGGWGYRRHFHGGW